MVPFVCLPPAVSAEAAATFQFDIPAGPLDAALTRFADQTGLSVGMTGGMPAVQTPAVKGRYTALAALRLLLADSGVEALATGPASFRLQPTPRGAPATAAVEPDLQSPEELSEIVVTGAKRAQNWLTVPNSMAVIDGDQLPAGALPGGSRTALLQDPATSSTNLGPGRNRQFIRGVADSAFLGPSQATVSVQFDETRATYDGPDPDLRLIDVDQVEILEGPQGPLYGTGALGGVYHIVPHRPDLQQWGLQGAVHSSAVAGGGFGTGADLVWNAPLTTDRAGVRAVVYAATEPGWIDNLGGRDDANDTQVRGGRVSVRGVLSDDWVLDMQGVVQSMRTADSQYLPGVLHPLQRTDIVPEPLDNDFHLGAVTLHGRLFGHSALFTISHVWHEADGVLDAGDSAAAWDTTAPLSYYDRRRYYLWNQEARMWSDADAPVTWLVGGSYLSSSSDITGTLLKADAAARQVLEISTHVGEAAVFGEASMPLSPAMHATVGLRLFDSEIENRSSAEARLLQGEPYVRAATPSFALDWRSPDLRRFYYLRFARAIRPGGLNPVDTSSDYSNYRSDTLSNLDLGMRLRDLNDRLAVQATLFATRWQHIQSDFLETDGLVGTRNVGDGRNFGIETMLTWSPARSWQVQGGAVVQHPRLYHAVVAVGDDPRLPVVPDLRLHGALIRSFDIGDWQAQLRTDVDYIGASRLSFEQSLDRRMGDVLTVDGSFELQRNRLELALHVGNLFDAHADTFAFGNPFSVRTVPQFTPQPPLTVTLTAGWRW